MLRGIRPAPVFLVALVVMVLMGTSTWVWRAWTARTEPAPNVAALVSASTQAAAVVRARQAAAGYWRTAVTRGQIFEQATSEVNVFVPAVIAELLEPVAKETGLEDVVERARAWLIAQIEDTGLVRYHGNPGPVANPGCELPPDSDDTALVWRLVPRAEGSVLQSARRTIEQYRTDRGLYRVWLAPEDTYRCFYKTYSGRELNPTDVAVQMHIYLFLARYDPESARRLCDALAPRMTDGTIWVYYKVAPFIPRLREIDLAQAGCPLRVPEGRLRGRAEPQEPYLELAALRRQLLLQENAEAARAAMLRTLSELAADDFAGIERIPPLLYHNDLTATPPHYHWSADVAYALWLRSYVDTVRRSAP